MRFQRASVPNRLSIDAIWRLYRTLKDGLVGDTQKYLVDEVASIMEQIDTESFKSSLRQMYGNDFGKNKTPLDFALMFIRGLKHNSFFSFHEFIRTISGRT